MEWDTKCSQNPGIAKIGYWPTVGDNLSYQSLNHKHARSQFTVAYIACVSRESSFVHSNLGLAQGNEGKTKWRNLYLPNVLAFQQKHPRFDVLWESLTSQTNEASPEGGQPARWGSVCTQQKSLLVHDWQHKWLYKHKLSFPPQQIYRFRSNNRTEDKLCDTQTQTTSQRKRWIVTCSGLCLLVRWPNQNQPLWS